jgi:hypothetical protein
MRKQVGKHVYKRRPCTRADCLNGPRPCPWVSCRYNLFLEVNSDTGSIKYNYPDQEIWDVDNSCALDIAEDGELTFEQIGGIFNLTRERIRQISNEILERIRERLFTGQSRESLWPLPWLPSDGDTMQPDNY